MLVHLLLPALLGSGAVVQLDLSEAVARASYVLVVEKAAAPTEKRC